VNFFILCFFCLVFSSITCFRQNKLSIQNLPALNPLCSLRLLYSSIRPLRIFPYSRLIVLHGICPRNSSIIVGILLGSLFVNRGDVCYFPLIRYKCLFKHWLIMLLIPYSFSVLELSAYIRSTYSIIPERHYRSFRCYLLLRC